MKFKDVAHLYVGCKVRSENGSNEIWTLNGVDLSSDGERIISGKTSKNMPVRCGCQCEKPILRPLSNMTPSEEEERDKLIFIGKINCVTKYTIKQHIVRQESPQSLVWLLSQHFDLFGLIESGEAIDATTLTPNPYNV